MIALTDKKPASNLAGFFYDNFYITKHLEKLLTLS